MPMCENKHLTRKMRQSRANGISIASYNHLVSSDF